MFYSQKRKSEDLNVEATNGQNEVMKEEDDADQVKAFFFFFTYLLVQDL